MEDEWLHNGYNVNSCMPLLLKQVLPIGENSWTNNTKIVKQCHSSHAVAAKFTPENIFSLLKLSVRCIPQFVTVTSFFSMISTHKLLQLFHEGGFSYVLGN